jgi:SAM-dependent methyltransferase
MKPTCHVCNSNNWIPLSGPAESQSVTTSARIIPQPLGKSVCSQCGLTQRTGAPFLGSTSYYEEDYASYYERPGSEEYHKKRSQQLVDWMNSFLLKCFNFKKVLDVGCGQGWAMDIMRTQWKDTIISGIEPSEYNAAIARKKGHRVYEGKIENINVEDKFDLVYSNNVIQHVNNVRAFIDSLRRLLTKDGMIIITCPDGHRPNIELFFSDHNYSFLSDNLIQIGNSLGFNRSIWDASEDNPSLPPAQLIMLTNNPLHSSREQYYTQREALNIHHVIARKIEYINSITDLGIFLGRQISGYANVYNFGASFWTSVLAAYCRDYWGRVNACIVDTNNNGEEFMGKNIIGLESIHNKQDSVIVLGTSPATHSLLTAKLEKDYKVIRWDSYFKY